MATDSTDPPEEEPTARAVVAVGASAGGLDALYEFFDKVAPDCDLSFVVLTHQPSGHRSLMPELLSRHTELAVTEAEDGARVEPGHVYLSVPGKNLAIMNGRLSTLEPSKSDLKKLPVDYFFRSLAMDQQERAIGVLLSGTGSDGTLGLKEIKGQNGMVMAQTPESADYSGMPHSAISTGLVDYVLRPAEMPEQLSSYVMNARLRGRPSESLSDFFQKVFVLLRDRIGHDFTHYKPSTIRRRLERRMSVHQIADPRTYLNLLQWDARELDLLFKELLIGVTSFFRDPEAFEALKGALKERLEATPSETGFRAWIPGCSSGEEAYSIAILVKECLEELDKRLDIQIFATDIDVEAVERARFGVFPSGIAADVTSDRLRRFFTQEESDYRVRKDVRELIVFAPQNVASDPPFGRLDLISCRNLLIYLDVPLQKKLLPLFHYALNENGLLFLGRSESLSSFEDHFETVDSEARLFRSKNSNVRAVIEMPAVGRPRTSPALARPQPRTGREREDHREGDLHRLLKHRLQREFIPPTAIINGRGDIVHIHGRTGLYLEPAPGQPSYNIYAMAREGLRAGLTSGLRQASSQPDTNVTRRLEVKTNGGVRPVEVTFRCFSAPEALKGLIMVSFQDAPEPPAAPSAEESQETAGRVERLEQELQYTRESYQGALEELETSNEELQSTNEEMQSTNEELQTSKEEMQSLNEELQTVNNELESKVSTLAEVNDDMQNLLNCTDIATIFLDTELRIKRYTSTALRVMNLRHSDVGRPIADLASKLDYEHLERDAAAVLDSLVPQEAELQNSDGIWYLMRITPYRTTENVIDGVVLTFVDITALKQAQRYAESIVETVLEPLVVLDHELRVVSANRSFCELFSTTSEQVERKRFDRIGESSWDVPELTKRLEEVLERDEPFERVEVTGDFPGAGRRKLRLNGRLLRRHPKEPSLLLLAMEQVSDR